MLAYSHSLDPPADTWSTAAYEPLDYAMEDAMMPNASAMFLAGAMTTPGKAVPGLTPGIAVPQTSYFDFV